MKNFLNQKEDEPKINQKNIIKFYKGIHQPSFGLDSGYYHPIFNYVKKEFQLLILSNPVNFIIIMSLLKMQMKKIMIILVVKGT